MTKYWWAFLLVGAGGYAFGRYDEWQRRQPPKDAPLPPIPTIDAIALPASYAKDWDDALSRYNIDFYPADAEHNLERLLPPPPPHGISVAPGCSVIAVGEDWWYAAAELAAKYEAQGQDVIRNVMRDLAPSCLSNNTRAAELLRKELKDWLSNQPQRNILVTRL